MLLPLLLACAPEPPPEPPAPTRPDLLLITVDTLRADRVGAYGDPLAQTKNLDKLAREGALFREAHAVTPLTLPSHTSMLTGLLPARHGLRDNAGFRLSDDVLTLAERLHGAGYHTAAFVSAYVLDPAWGLDQGFDLYRAPFHPQDVAKATVFGAVELPSAEVVNAAVGWWRGTAGPRFAWVHLYDPHTPWADHPQWDGDPYRGEVAFADSLLGRLLDAAGGQSWVIATSDHGEGLWEQGEREHGVLIDRAATRVPLIIRPPGGLSGSQAPAPRPGLDAVQRPDGLDPTLDLTPIPDAPRAARVVETPVSGLDLTPTLLEIAGLPTAGLDGISLLSAVRGEALTRAPVYAETYYPLFHLGMSALQMAQDTSDRLERGAWAARYAWQTDPSGRGAQRADAPALAAILDASDGEGVAAPGALDARTAAALEALGYLSAPAPAASDAPDPRDQIGALGALRAAEAIDDPAQAIKALTKIVEESPNLADARISRATRLRATGDLAGALADNQAVLTRWPEHPTALNNAAFLARELGQQDLALGYARHLQALNPHDARGFRLEVAIQVDREEPAEVLRVARLGLVAAPEDPNLHYLLALAEIQVGDPAAALEHLEAAQRFGSRASDLALWRGAALEKGGRLDEAKIAYDQAARDMVKDYRPWARIGVMYANAGRCSDAEPYLVNLAKRGGAGDPTIRKALEMCQIAWSGRGKAPAP